MNRLSGMLLATLLFITTAPATAMNITTVAGVGNVHNNVPATTVGLVSPTGIAVDGAGNHFIVSWYSASVYKVDPSGQLTTVVGLGAHQGPRSDPISRRCQPLVKMKVGAASPVAIYQKLFGIRHRQYSLLVASSKE